MMRKYTPLICKDCSIEIFVDVNMVMIKDEIWKQICDKTEDAYCDCCMEKRLGRKIVIEDFKISSLAGSSLYMIPCNAMWLHYKENKKENEYKTN